MKGPLRLFVAFILLSTIATIAIVQRERGPERRTTKATSEWITTVPDGWRRCWRPYEFSIALPLEWSTSPKPDDACLLADPEPFKVAKGKEHPLTAIRVIPRDSTSEVDPPFSVHLSARAWRELTDPKLWDVQLVKETKVDGRPARAVEIEAKRGGKYEYGTKIYAYLIATGADDSRCAGDYSFAGRFIGCSGFIVSANAPPDRLDEFKGFKKTLDRAVRSIRFYVYEAERDPRALVEVWCFLRERGAPGCNSPAVRGMPRGADRYVILNEVERRQGVTQYAVRSYVDDGYSDDIVTLKGRESSQFSLNNNADWQVASWERGVVLPYGERQEVRVYLPERDACKRFVNEPTISRRDDFRPSDLVAISRQIPARDYARSVVANEVFMGATGQEVALSFPPFRFDAVGFGRQGAYVGNASEGEGCEGELWMYALERSLAPYTGGKGLGSVWVGQ